MRLALAIVAKGFLKMRASHFAVLAVLATPSAAQSQDNGLVDGRVGSDLSTSSTQSGSPLGLQGHISAPLNPARALAPQGWSCPAKLFPRKCPSL